MHASWHCITTGTFDKNMSSTLANVYVEELNVFGLHSKIATCHGTSKLADWSVLQAPAF